MSKMVRWLNPRKLENLGRFKVEQFYLKLGLENPEAEREKQLAC